MKLLWRGMLGLRALTVTLMLAGLLAAGARTSSAQDDESGLDDNTFTGPNFGWSVEWDEDVWEFDTENNSGGSDFMRLQTIDEDLFALVAFQGIEFDGADTEECALSWEGILADGEANSDVELSEDLPLPDAPRDADGAAFTYVLELDGGDTIDLVDYNECRVLVEDTAILQVLLTVPANIYEDVIPLLEDLTAEIVLPDDSGSTEDDEDVTPQADDEETPEADEEETPEADDEETPEADDEDEDADAEPTRDVRLGEEDEETDEEDEDPISGSGIDGNAYISPTYGFTIEWDEDDWTVDPERELIADGSVELDRLFVTHEDDDGFYASFYIEGKVDYDGDALDCVEGEADLLSGEDAVVDFEPLEDAGGDPVEGESDNGGEFAAFVATIETDEGDEVELVEYIECQTLEDGETVVVFTLITSEDLFEDELALAEDVIATLELDGGDNSADDEPADDEEPTEEPVDEDEDEAAFAAKGRSIVA